MCRYGFSPTITEVREIIYDYLESNVKTVACFKDGRPGKDWFKAFMKRNNLSMKHAEMMCAARKKATENPLVVYEFYEMIDEIIKGKNLTVKQIWNTDESGFPVDPTKCKVITKRGETAYKVTLGPGSENNSVLATFNADGRVLPPLIIYAGKNLQSTWRGHKDLPGTMYSVSDSGWMTSEVFFFLV